MSAYLEEVCNYEECKIEKTQQEIYASHKSKDHIDE